MGLNIIFWLMIKHFICDFPLQAFSYMYSNKGTFGHFGGVLHSLVHLIGTFIVMSFYTSYINAFSLALFDFVCHYLIDWWKMNFNIKRNLKPDNSEWFWIILGYDQLLHFFTYFIIVKFIGSSL